MESTIDLIAARAVEPLSKHRFGNDAESHHSRRNFQEGLRFMLSPPAHTA